MKGKHIAYRVSRILPKKEAAPDRISFLRSGGYFWKFLVSNIHGYLSFFSFEILAPSCFLIPQDSELFHRKNPPV